MSDRRAISRDLLESPRTFRDLSSVEGWADSLGAAAGHRPYAANEPIEGPEFSVVTETVKGMHRVVSIVPQPEDEDAAPAPASEEDAAVLRSLVRSLLDLAGYEDGPARAQVVLTAFGPRIVECCLGG